MFKVPEEYRIKNHPLIFFNSDNSHGNNGAFKIPIDKENGIEAFVIASDKLDWEHVSVTIKENGKSETPTWEEMCVIKELFWDDTDCVVQFHPPKSEHVNMHEHCLHLWRPKDIAFPVPPKIMVGV